MDRFKEYLKDNADKLDTDLPTKDLWESIEPQTTTTKRISPIKTIFFQCIAAACFFALCIAFIHQLLIGDKKTKAVTSAEKVITDTLFKKNPAIVQPVMSSASLVTALPEKNRPVHRKRLATVVKSGNADDSYEGLINSRIKRLGNIPVFAASPGYFSVFTRQLKKMERDEQVIKEQLGRNGYSDELMDQLIEVYQQKLYLLKRFQSEIQTINNRVKQQRPADSLSQPYYIKL